MVDLDDDAHLVVMLIMWTGRMPSLEPGRERVMGVVSLKMTTSRLVSISSRSQLELRGTIVQLSLDEA